jgi:hypothetical protein
MNREMVGFPDIFAIEFYVEFVKAETVYGGCRLWMEGKYLGDIFETCCLGIASSEIYVPIALHGSEPSIPDSNIPDSDIPEITSSPTEFVRMLENQGDDWASVFTYEPWDKFRKTFYWQGNKFIFYWCLSPRVAADIETYPQFKDYPKTVQRAEVSIGKMKEVTEEFRARIKELIAEYESKK